MNSGWDTTYDQVLTQARQCQIAGAAWYYIWGGGSFMVSDYTNEVIIHIEDECVAISEEAEEGGKAMDEYLKFRYTQEKVRGTIGSDALQKVAEDLWKDLARKIWFKVGSQIGDCVSEELIREVQGVMMPNVIKA